MHTQLFSLGLRHLCLDIFQGLLCQAETCHKPQSITGDNTHTYFMFHKALHTCQYHVFSCFLVAALTLMQKKKFKTAFG